MSHPGERSRSNSDRTPSVVDGILSTLRRGRGTDETDEDGGVPSVVGKGDRLTVGAAPADRAGEDRPEAK